MEETNATLAWSGRGNAPVKWRAWSHGCYSSQQVTVPHGRREPSYGDFDATHMRLRVATPPHALT